MNTQPLKLFSPRVLFFDRYDAGKKLAVELKKYAGSDAVIMAIPRGGVAVASPISRELHLPLDVLIVRKIPIPGNPEMGMGAITSDGSVLLDEPLLRELGITAQRAERIAASVKLEMQRRVHLYRGDKPYPDLSNRTVILVDDGLATGFTMLAAIKSMKGKKVSRLVIAVPVSSFQAFSVVSRQADEFITLAIQEAPEFAVASFYREWSDMSDEEVLDLLSKNKDFNNAGERLSD